MAAKNTWVDYGNLAANLIQTAQLSGVWRAVDNQTQLTATTLAFEQNQDRLRESVFQAETLLRNLQAARMRNQNVVGVYALALESLQNLKRGQISKHLRSFEDKTRLRNVEEGFEALLTDCASLSADDQEQAELCALYRLEERDLDSAICLKQTRHQLDEYKAKLEAAESQIAPGRRATKIAFYAVSTILAGLVLIGLDIDDNMGHPFVRLLGWCLVGIGAAAAALSLCFMAKFQLDREANGTASESDKEALSRKVANLEIAFAVPRSEAENQWENKSLAELQQTRQERTSLVNEVLDQ